VGMGSPIFDTTPKPGIETLWNRSTFLVNGLHSDMTLPISSRLPFLYRRTTIGYCTNVVIYGYARGN
ncbi:MAG: hypothetical protein Q8S19_04590, partial [Bacillota bacterium]|nr:hypothetical protein [Bacillota bacterium]